MTNPLSFYAECILPNPWWITEDNGDGTMTVRYPIPAVTLGEYVFDTSSYITLNPLRQYGKPWTLGTIELPQVYSGASSESTPPLSETGESDHDISQQEG